MFHVITKTFQEKTDDVQSNNRLLGELLQEHNLPEASHHFLIDYFPKIAQRLQFF